MDLRALVAGTNVGHERLAELVEEIGAGAVRSRRSPTSTTAPARPSGSGSASWPTASTARRSWAEWRGELFKIPCTLTIDGSIDDTSTSRARRRRRRHFLNSKEHVVKSMLSMYLGNFLLGDLPLNQGYLDSFDVHCPEGSILNATPPSPVAAAHLLACMDAVDAALRCVVAAAAASPGSHVSRYLAGSCPALGAGDHDVGGSGSLGRRDAWLMLDNCAMGSPAASDRDGSDFYYEIGQPPGHAGGRTTSRPPRRGTRCGSRYQPPGQHVLAPGQRRGGAGVELAYQTPAPRGDRRHVPSASTVDLPCIGAAGGLEGRRADIAIRHADGSEQELSLIDQGFQLGAR